MLVGNVSWQGCQGVSVELGNVGPRSRVALPPVFSLFPDYAVLAGFSGVGVNAEWGGCRREPYRFAGDSLRGTAGETCRSPNGMNSVLRVRKGDRDVDEARAGGAGGGLAGFGGRVGVSLGGADRGADARL